jgi:hypothetical protein
MGMFIGPSRRGSENRTIQDPFQTNPRRPTTGGGCQHVQLRFTALSGGDAKLEEWLDKKGVKWEFLPAVSPESFDQEKSLRNQARVFAPLNEKRAEQYTEAMKRGDEFPPVIAHGKKNKMILLDGNRT